MNDRIHRLVAAARAGDIYPKPVQVEYDEFDLKLSDPQRIAKRLTEYMAAQPCAFSDDNELVGMMRFDGSVEGPLFPRTGHRAFREVYGKYYKKPQENLCTFEWQHSNADFGKVIGIGLAGLRKEIVEARRRYESDIPRLSFLAGLESMIRGIVNRSRQYAAECRRRAAECADPVRKATLMRMAGNCMQVPEHPARTFEEAVQCLYFCFQFQPDSIGRPDQYLLPFYERGLADGTLTREHARELLQELYVMIHGFTKPGNPHNSDKGAESHFVVGGYTLDHRCAWNDLSEMILDSLMETDLIRPQISLRWNRLTPRSVLRRMLDAERHDKNKRIAFVSDEPRIADMTGRRGIPWEQACDYIMVGCNEPAFQGGISLGGNTVNIVRSLVRTLDGRRAEVLACRDFDSFYRSVAAFAEGRTDFFGHPLTFGNLTGYHPHFAWHGAGTKATPDGRVAGSALLFGGGQSDGKDRDGVTSLLRAVAHMDPTCVMTGNSIFNLSVDERIVTDDESFEKLVALVETYFKEGGLHIQLNHVSADELRAAKANPDAYKSLRVRVSGFSAYFVGLTESIQDDVIARTEHKA